MTRFFKSLLCGAGCWVAATAMTRAAAFPEPAGGWTYLYSGDQLQREDPLALDGTWDHNNNSDAWDGSEVGGTLDAGGGAFGKNSPGGASLGTQNGVNYLRLQDTGDPRDYGFSDPCSRKMYFGHDITADIDPAKAGTLMDTGVTLTFRARIPTLAKAGPPLDKLYRDGQQSAGPQPYPDAGDGYVTSDGGKGNFVIYQNGGGDATRAGGIAFSFTQTTDTTSGDPNTGQAKFAGLTFNEFNGNKPTDQVNFGQGSKTNVVAFDPTEWHELYIVLLKDAANIGTHEGFVFLDGNLTPTVFKLTAGTGKDVNFDAFLALGGSATPQNWALDVDFFGYKDEAVFPPGAKLPPSITQVVPDYNAVFQNAATGLSFNASVRMPGNKLPAAGLKLALNGQDLSSQLTLTGTDTSTSRSASYQGLQANTPYSGTIIVTDSGGLSSTNEVQFDTFVESQVTVIEAEDYNYGSGQFLDNPAANAYAAESGTPGIDFQDTTQNTLGAYRQQDSADTAATADVPRTKYTSAGLTDYQLGGITAAEWWNYTRTLGTGNYLVYVRAACTTAQDLRLDRVVGTAGQASQILEYLGTLHLPRTGTLNTFQYVPLVDVTGKPVVVPLSGKTTLRLSALSAREDLALNFLMLAPAGSAATAASVAVQPTAGASGVMADVPVMAAIYDGANPVDTGSVKLSVNGTQVPAVVARSGKLTTVQSLPAQLWAPSTAYALSLTFNDGTGHTVDWSFTTANFLVLTPAMKVTDARNAGFVWRMFQNEANQDTSVARAEAALAGQLKDGNGDPLPNLADAAVTGPATSAGTPAQPGPGTMTFKIPTVINLSQAEGEAYGGFTPDEQMPGIPGTSASTDGIAVEIRANIELPRGVATMILNSDDGFQTTAGFLNDTPLVLGEVNGGRSSSDTLMQVAVQEAGVYAFRTVYFEGNGNASVEWSVLKPDGSRVLINDTANGGPRAYQDGTVPRQPADNVTVTITAAAGGQVTLAWSAGTLQSADAVSGPFSTVTGAASPYTTPASGTAKFYRVKVP